MSSEMKEVLSPSKEEIQGTSSESTNEKEEQYTAEKILDKPTVSGETQNFIKSEGYSADENTEENKDTIRYETHDATSDRTINVLPEEILSAVKVDGDLWFLVKWKGTDQASYILADEAEISHPQMVFSFYEKIIEFK